MGTINFHFTNLSMSEKGVNSSYEKQTTKSHSSEKGLLVSVT